LSNRASEATIAWVGRAALTFPQSASPESLMLCLLVQDCTAESTQRCKLNVETFLFVGHAFDWTHGACFVSYALLSVGAA